MAGTLGVAAGERVAEEVWRTGALGPVVDRLAVRVLAAHSVTAGRDTAVGLSVTCLRLTALPVRVTLVSAALQWVPNVGCPTATDRSVVICDLAVSVDATRSTNLVSCEPPTVAERISGGAAGATTDRHMVLHRAVGALAAGDGARVYTVIVLTRSLGAAVLVLVTLALYTPGVRIALVTGQTFTHRPPSLVPALGTVATNSFEARVGTTAGPAVRTAEVPAPAGAHCSLPAPGTVGIRSTGVLKAGVETAGDVRVSNMTGRTLADRRTAVILTDCLLTARGAAAGVEPAVCVRVSGVAWLTLAHSGPAVRCTVRVSAAGTGRARLQPTLGEGISDITGATSTDGALSSGRTVGVHSTRTLLARVEVTLDERVSFIVRSAATDCPGSGGGAVRVNATRRLRTGVQTTVHERITFIAFPTLTDCPVPIGQTFCIGATGTLGAWVCITPYEWIPSITVWTLTDSSAPASTPFTPSVNSTGTLGTRV